MDEITRIAGDIINSKRFEQAKKVPHHYTSNVAEHSLAVADEAYEIACRLNERGIAVSKFDVVRGSLMHDLGMTEDHIFFSKFYIKARTHPVQGMLIAKNEFKANKKQLDAIRRHMWPIGFVPPGHKEGWVVLMADKICAYREVVKNRK